MHTILLVTRNKSLGGSAAGSAGNMKLQDWPTDIWYQVFEYVKPAPATVIDITVCYKKQKPSSSADADWLYHSLRLVCAKFNQTFVDYPQLVTHLASYLTGPLPDSLFSMASTHQISSLILAADPKPSSSLLAWV